MDNPLYKLFKRFGWRAIGTDTPAEARAELGKSPVFAAERERIAAQARIQQREILDHATAIGQRNNQIEHKAVNGLGVKVGEIPLKAVIQQRQLHGDDCWEDPGFVQAFFRDNPQLRVQTKRGTHGQEYVRPRPMLRPTNLKPYVI